MSYVRLNGDLCFDIHPGEERLAKCQSCDWPVEDTNVRQVVICQRCAIDGKRTVVQPMGRFGIEFEFHVGEEYYGESRMGKVKDFVCGFQENKTQIVNEVKYDNSLRIDLGVELTTLPLTFNQHERLSVPLMAALAEAVDASCDDRCGMHIHFNANKQISHGAIAAVIGRFITTLDRVFGRNGQWYNSPPAVFGGTVWSGPSGGVRLGDTPVNYKSTLIAYRGSTYELRAPAGSTDPDRIMANLEFARQFRKWGMEHNTAESLLVSEDDFMNHMLDGSRYARKFYAA